MSDDPKQDYFVDGITEDLITELSKLTGFAIDYIRLPEVEVFANE